MPLDPERPDYLFDALDDELDHGSTGPFSDRDHRRSPQLVLATHRGALAGAAATAVAAGLSAWAVARADERARPSPTRRGTPSCARRWA